jgi:hypothetical protein
MTSDSLVQDRNLQQVVKETLCLWPHLLVLGVAYGIVSYCFYVLKDDLNPRSFLALFALAIRTASSTALSAFMVQTIVARYEPSKRDLRESLQALASKFASLCWASFRFAGIVTLFAVSIVGIPIAINRAVRWIFIPQAILIDDATGADTLDESSRVVKGNWLLVFTTLGSLFALGIGSGIVVGFLDGGGSREIESAARLAVFAPLLAAFSTLLYASLKAREQGN